MSAPLCAVPTCGRRRAVQWNGLCDSHSERLRLYGDPFAGPPIADRRPGRREYVIGEIEWFFTCGVSPELTMNALGYTNRDSIVQTLKRWGRPDLAERFMERQEESWFNQWLEGKYRVA